MGDQFAWFETGNVIPIGNSNQIFVTPLLTTDYTIEVTVSSTGCFVQQSVLVNVNPTPQAAFSIGSEFCASSIIQPQNLTQPSNVQFTWNLNGPTTATFTTFEPILSNLSNGNYQLSLIAEVGGCSDILAPIGFVVYQPPSINFNIGSYNSCSGSNIPLSAVVNGTESNYTYNWQFGNFQTSNLIDPGLINFPEPVLNDTSIIVFLTVSSNVCSVVSADTLIAIQVIPSIQFLIPLANGCSTFQTTTPVQFYGQPSNISLQLENGFSTNDLNFVFSFSANGTPQTYLIFAEASNSCGISYDTMQVFVTPNPVFPDVISSLPLQGICSGTFAQFASVSTGSTDSLLAFQWFVDGTLIVAGTPSFSYQFDMPGNFQIGLKVSDGCSDSTLIFPVQVLMRPEVSFVINPGIVCENQSITLNALANDAVFYQWNTGDGQSYFTSSATFSYPQSGNYTVSIFVSDQNGFCTDSASAAIQVFPAPQVNVQANVLGTCVNNWVVFNSTITGASNFNWDFDNTANSVFPNDSSFYTIAGNYTATLTAFNLAGCTAMDAVSFEIFPKPISIPFFDAQLNGPLCGIPVGAQITNLSQGAFAYQWFLDNAFLSNLFEPLLPINTFGVHTVDLVAATALGCFDTASIQLNVFEKPDLLLEVSPQEGCQVLNTFIDPTCMNCSGVKVQSSGNILSEDFDEFVAQWLLPGIFTIQMSGTTANGCRDTVFQAIEVFEKPEALFTVSPTVLNDLVVDFSFIDLSTSNDPLNYLFFLNNVETYGFFPTLLTVNMLDQPFDSLMFTLITTTNQGCQDTANIQIPINTTGGIYIPNAFSPNDDNINDWFKPLGFNYLDLNFEIFDRWGNSIYSETVDQIEKLIGWNGKINNNAVKHDVYVYRIRAKEFNGKTYKTTGRVTLIR